MLRRPRAATIRARSARVRASAAGQEPTLSLPRDQLNNVSNWIPDNGWLGPDTEVISDTFGINDAWNADNDTLSLAAAPPPAVGLAGDGLKLFEEYRGFVVNGVHVRTNPTKKDLFVSSLVQRVPQGLSQEQSLDFARESLALRGAKVHYLLDHTQALTFSAREYRVIGPCNELPALGGTEQCVRILNINSVWGGQGQSPPVDWVRTQGTLRLTMRGQLTGQASGLTQGGCVNGGSTPAPPGQAWWIFIDINEIISDAQAANQSANTQINNEVRRTAGHEIGHGLHVKHRAPPDPGCVLDSAVVGSGPSLMDSAWGGGVGMGQPASRYNDSDVLQMRWHQNAN